MLKGLGAPESPISVNWAATPVHPRFDLVVAGVGKANAAAAVARALDLNRHHAVISLGVSGSLPGSGLSIGDIVDADRTTYADEGSVNPDGFTTIAEMGFGPLADLCGAGNGMDAMGIACTPLLARRNSRILGHDIRVGGLATVSTCSGNDAHAADVARRTGALAEDMESAAVGFTAARLAPRTPFSAIRAISNSTGDRFHQQWDLEAALRSLAVAVALL